MPRIPRRVCRFATTLVAACALASATPAADNLAQLAQQTFQAAASRVEPCVVRIETVGGLERVGPVLTGTSATTGLIVSPDGHVVTSAFNLVQKPSSILVTLPDGAKYAARLLARDHSRMLALLKIDAPNSLPVPQAVPADEVRVGAWAIAVGRTFTAEQLNLSVGIISGVNRVWGKAIQTDAKISPSNYGGPLVDLEGRVFGLLVPLSPDSNSEVAGAEWYDSGIGFAIPLTHVFDVLPKLQQGDLHPGLLGIGLKPGSPFGQAALIAAVRPNSPAAKSGLKAGDTIIEIDGRPIQSQAQLRARLNPRYAGERIELVALRGDERIEIAAELVAELVPYQHPFLGILPKRGTTGQGIVIRHVYPDSPAAAAGLDPGDVLLALAGEVVPDRAAAEQKLNALEPAAKLALHLRRGDQEFDREVTLAALPESLPQELPPAQDPATADAAGGQIVTISLPEFPNKCQAYLPAGHDPSVPHGLVMWLHDAGGLDVEKLLDQWRPVCNAFHLILLAPQAVDPAAWKPAELDFIAKALQQAMSGYQIDPTRIVVAGAQRGAALALLVAFRQREQIRGVVAVNGALAQPPPDNEPAQRLAIYAATTADSRFAKASGALVEQLRARKYPVTARDLDAKEQPDAAEMLEIGRWIDTLDRL